MRNEKIAISNNKGSHSFCAAFAINVNWVFTSYFAQRFNLQLGSSVKSYFSSLMNAKNSILLSKYRKWVFCKCANNLFTLDVNPKGRLKMEKSQKRVSHLINWNTSLCPRERYIAMALSNFLWWVYNVAKIHFNSKLSGIKSSWFNTWSTIKAVS